MEREEVPKPWTQSVWGGDIQKQLKAFFSDSTDLIMRGPEAKKFFDELQKEEFERKRDKKERLKEKMNSLDKK